MAWETLRFDSSFQNPRELASRKVTLSKKFFWEDEEWTPIPGARLDSCQWSCSPSIPHARFHVRYGYGIDPGEVTPTKKKHPMNLQGCFLRVQIGPESDPDWTWYGIIELAADRMEGEVNAVSPPVASGQVEFVALGLEHLLEGHRLHRSSFVRENAEGVMEVVDTDVGLTFNKDGRGNRSPDKVNGYYHFYSDDSAANFWSSRDIIEYLFRSPHGVPRNASGQQEIPFIINPSYLRFIPDWDTPEVETHLVTLTQILNALINRRRFLTWWLDSLGANVSVKVATFTDTAIVLDGKRNRLVNPNFDQIKLDIRNEPQMVVMQEDRTHRADQVIAYGARRRHVCTLRFNLEMAPGWDSQQETAYESGMTTDPSYPSSTEVEERQRFVKNARRKEEHRSVYSRFVLDRTYKFLEDVGDPDGYQMFFDNLMIEPRLPLITDADFGGNAVDSGNVVQHGDGPWPEREPLVYIEKPLDPSKYVRVEDMAATADNEVVNEEEVTDFSCSVRVPKDGKNIILRVNGAPQHAIAFGTFSPISGVDEEVFGEWDWRSINATVSLRDERYCQQTYPPDEQTNRNSVKRLIRIAAGSQYRQDYIAGGTTVDLDDEGTEIRVNDRGGYIRDDSEKLLGVAKLAYQWYGRDRVVLRLTGTYDSPCNQLRIGQYVKSIHRTDDPNVASRQFMAQWRFREHRRRLPWIEETVFVNPDIEMEEEINSLLTQFSIQMTHEDDGDEPRNDLPPMKFSLQTAFGELDLVHLRGSNRRDVIE